MSHINRRLFLGAAAASVAALPGFTRGADLPAGSVKIVGIAGSLRKGKSTYKAVQLALESAKAISPAVTTDIIELSGLNLDPYIAVGSKVPIALMIFPESVKNSSPRMFSASSWARQYIWGSSHRR